MPDRPIESAVRELKYHVDRIPDVRRVSEDTIDALVDPEAFPDLPLGNRPVHVTGTIGRQGTEVSVHVHVEYGLTLECVRCLDTFPLAGSVSEYGHFIHRRQGGASYPEHEQYGDDGQVDLVPWLRELILTDLPKYPLCREGCLGLCDRCGGNRNRGECRCPA